MTTKALVLLSGGLDSTTVATMAVQEFGSANVVAASLSYGQKHSVELAAATMVAGRLGISQAIYELPRIFEGYGSSLVDADRENPEQTYAEISQGEGPAPAYVPFRNGNLISAATTIALVKGCEYIYYGAHAEDARNFAYPDCTFEFNGAMANAVYVGTYGKARLVVPLQFMTKKDVVIKANEIGAPIELTYSCYNGTTPSCGRCATCVSRIEAFLAAGFEDPIRYQ